MTTATARSAVDHEEQHRLTAVQGLAALSLDALSSVAYGPEAILVVLIAAGATALHYALPITGAIVVLLAVLVVSYRQVIAAFPNGGGAYAVSKAHLGTQASLVAAASLIVDYVLNAAVGVSAGIEALYSAFPVLYGARVWLCLAVLALITGLNLWGVSESAKVFTVPTLLFILSMAAVIGGGLIRTNPAVALNHHIGPSTETVGIDRGGGDRERRAGVPQAAGAPRATHGDVARHPARHHADRAGDPDPQIRRGAALEHHGARAAHRGVARSQFRLLRDRAHHHGAARAGRQYLVRWPAGAGGPAGQGQFPAAHVRAARGPAGAPLRRRGAGHPGRHPARGGQGRHAGTGPAVRRRGVHRVHAVPVRHGQALEGRTVPGLEEPGGHQRLRGRPDRADHDHRAGQQVHRGRVADRARHPGPGAAVQPGAPHLRPDRRHARAGPDAEAAGEAEVARRRSGLGDIAAHRRGHLGGALSRR